MAAPLTQKQYVQTLERFREYIAGGGELSYFDSTAVGDKDTQCTWGLCSRKKALWPDKETHVWPNDERDQGSDEIYGIKQLNQGQLCPMDKRASGSPSGCFYYCRVFQGPKPTREEALRLYDLKIAAEKEKF